MNFILQTNYDIKRNKCQCTLFYYFFILDKNFQIMLCSISKVRKIPVSFRYARRSESWKENGVQIPARNGAVSIEILLCRRKPVIGATWEGSGRNRLRYKSEELQETIMNTTYPVLWYYATKKRSQQLENPKRSIQLLRFFMNWKYNQMNHKEVF